MESISPEVKALTTFIEASVNELQNGGNTPSPGEALLFIGNWHESFPRLIFEDPVLKPVDRNVWAAIKLRTSSNKATAFPSYEELCAACNIEGRATISRAIAILRATRWLTLCKRVRIRGKVAGNIYALHDEPLQLSDTLFLDPDYMKFLEEAALKHPHPRAKAICRAVLQTIEADIDAGRDVITPESGLNRRMEAIGTLRQLSTSGRGLVNDSSLPARNGFYSINIAGIASINQKPDREGNRVQKLNSEAPSTETELRRSEPSTVSVLRNQRIDSKEIFKGDCCKAEASTVSVLRSSSSNKNTTTTTLEYPDELSENERRLATKYLAKIPEHQRQAVLDALEAKFQAIKQGGDGWQYGPVPYLRALCRRVLDGTFVELPVTKQQQAKESKELSRKRLELMNEIQGLNDLMSAPGSAVEELRRLRDKLTRQLEALGQGVTAGEGSG